MQDGDQWPCAYVNSDLNYNYDCKLKDWLANLTRLNDVSRLTQVGICPGGRLLLDLVCTYIYASIECSMISVGD